MILLAAIAATAGAIVASAQGSGAPRLERRAAPVQPAIEMAPPRRSQPLERVRPVRPQPPRPRPAPGTLLRSRLGAFCRQERRARVAYEAQRPPLGSSASVYIPYLAVGARRATALSTDLRRVAGRAASEPDWQRLLGLVAADDRFAHALLDAAQRRDASAYAAASEALARDARAERSAAAKVGAGACVD